MMIEHFSLFFCLFIFMLLSPRTLVAFDKNNETLFELVRGKSFEYCGTRAVSRAQKINYNIIVKMAFHEQDILDENNPRIIPGLIEAHFFINSMSPIRSSERNESITFYFREPYRVGLWAVDFHGKDDLWHKVAQYFGIKEMALKMPKVVAMRYNVATTGNELVLIFGVGIMEILHLREIKH